MTNGGNLTQLTRDLERLERQVQSLRLVLFRTAVFVSLSLVVVGVALPIWHDNVDGEPTTVRVVTAGFQGFAHAHGEAADVLLGVGFLGLLIVVLMLAGLLLQAVLAQTPPPANNVARAWIGVLAIVGTAVAGLFSAIAAGSDVSGSSGGWGAVVLMGGVVLSLVVLSNAALVGRD